LEARIVAVVDAFDAMTTNRAYRPQLPVSQAIEELRRCAGVHFDAEVVEAFLHAHGNGSRLPIS
jgi:HD-GYP domain-containing protein (c-di-GMP phosphodiesterase class II)